MVTLVFCSPRTNQAVRDDPDRVRFHGRMLHSTGYLGEANGAEVEAELSLKPREIRRRGRIWLIKPWEV
jgi:hypothetical protein